MTRGSIVYHFLLAWRSREELIHLTDEGRLHLLLEIVRAGQSENNWLAILELFASWPEGTVNENAYQWCNEQLRSWSDELRKINSSWGYLYNGRQLDAIARLARTIEILRREQHGNSELISITSSSYVRDLKRLVIGNSGIYADGLKTLATSQHLSSLEHLALDSITLGDEEFDILCTASKLTSLSWLRLRKVGLNTPRLIKLLQSPLMRKVEKLELQSNHLDDVSMTMLASSGATAALKQLNLAGNFIRDDGARTLAGASNLRNLQQLDVSRNHLTAQGNELLRNSSIFKNTSVLL